MRNLVVLPLLLIGSVFGLPLAAEDPAFSHNSWIEIVDDAADHTYLEGQPWTVKVAWHLDPADDHGGTQVALQAVGPWVDCPDGTYEKKRHHVDYPGANLSGSCPASAGDGTHTFDFTIPKALSNNGLMLICHFVDGKGKGFPWEVRGGGPYFTRADGFFELVTDKPSNLFTLAEPLRLSARLKKQAIGAGERALVVSVYDTKKNLLEHHEVKFTAEKEGQEVPIEIETKARGCLLVEAEAAGWEKRSTTVCRIPDVLAVTKGGPTKFGMHGAILSGDLARCETVCASAQRLGLTTSRNFVGWRGLEPARGQFRFERLDRQIEIARKHGIDPILTLIDPPPWALKGKAYHANYAAFECDLDAWKEFVGAAASHWKGKLYAWEWLNEITTGGSFETTPTQAYLQFCRAGSEVLRKTDPSANILLAGGLWPRSFRTEVLQAGVGETIDVLPVHYSSGEGIVEARSDLDTAGLAKVAVWDDESGHGMNTFGVPPLEQIGETSQSRWVMSQWIDELTAGVEHILWFSGGADSAGNWAYALDDFSPRPVCATLALVAAKLHQAKPLGAFWEGKGCFELFEREGKVVVCAQPGEREDKARLKVGTSRVTATDYQGNETEIACTNGIAELAMDPVGTFYEGGDPDTLKAYVVATLQTAKTLQPRGGRAASDFRTTMILGETGNLYVGLRNPYATKIAGTLTLASTDLGSIAPVPFDLAPGAESVASIPVAIVKDARAGEHPVQLHVAFTSKTLPEVEKPATIVVISPDMLGNLLKNGDFEAADGKPWTGHGKIESAAGLGLGHGDKVLRFANSKSYVTEAQSVELSPGSTYLYSAWVWNDGMGCGSNISESLAGGKTNNLFDIRVFKLPSSTPSWQLYTMRYTAPADLVSAAFIPVANGAGWAVYDNMRLTLFAGTDFAAEAARSEKPPKIDGKLDDWNRSCPIPLIGMNQVTKVDASYAWTPDNLSAVAYTMWDEANLYVAIQVRDDKLVASGGDASVIEGDSVVLAIDPTDRGADADKRSFALYLSAQHPGGGSGATTIYRPAEHAGGLRSGQLARDSSIYEMAIAKVDQDADGRSGWIYELRIPFSELGGFQAGLGRRLALSLQVNDNDGKGRAAAMTWGGGLLPQWQPGSFGMVTLVRQP